MERVWLAFVTQVAVSMFGEDVRDKQHTQPPPQIRSFFCSSFRLARDKAEMTGHLVDEYDRESEVVYKSM